MQIIIQVLLQGEKSGRKEWVDWMEGSKRINQGMTKTFCVDVDAKRAKKVKFHNNLFCM